jgi:hypothetical protein
MAYFTIKRVSVVKQNINKVVKSYKDVKRYWKNVTKWIKDVDE